MDSKSGISSSSPISSHGLNDRASSGKSMEDEALRAKNVPKKLPDDEERAFSSVDLGSRRVEPEKRIFADLSNIRTDLADFRDHLLMLNRLDGSTLSDSRQHLNSLCDLLSKLDHSIQTISVFSGTAKSWQRASKSIPETALSQNASGQMDRPKLQEPERINLQKKLVEINESLTKLKQVYDHDSFNPVTCYSKISEVFTKTSELSVMLLEVDQALEEAEHKTGKSVCLDDIYRGSSGILMKTSLSMLASGLMKVLKTGLKGIRTVENIASGFSSLTLRMGAGLVWSGKGFLYYGGIALFTPIFILKKLYEDDQDPWLKKLCSFSEPDFKPITSSESPRHDSVPAKTEVLAKGVEERLDFKKTEDDAELWWQLCEQVDKFSETESREGCN